MRCPNCKSAGLSHTLLSNGLTAHGCQSCDGMLLSLVAYRRWYEVHGSSADELRRSEADLVIEDSPDAKICQKCSRLMIKYRIAPDVDNRLDYCAHCEDIWLDKGEWELVEKIAASGELTRILTQPWQRRILRNTADEMASERLRRRLGDDYDKLMSIREWIWSHPDRDLILAHLHQQIGRTI